MNPKLRKLFAASVATGAVLAGGSAAARTLHAASTPARVATPAASAATPLAVEAHQALPAVAVEQALPVSARTSGAMPIQGQWDRQTPQAINVNQPLGQIDIAQTVPEVHVGAIAVNLPANVAYDVSTNGASAGVSSNLASVGADVSTSGGPALAELSTKALGINNELQVAARR